MKLLKKILFWSHLVAGVAGGIIIALLALTGAVYAFEPQLSGFFEPATQAVTPVTGAPHLSAQALLDRANNVLPGRRWVNVVLNSSAAKPAYIQSADRQRLYFHQQTSEVVATRSPSHVFTLAIFLHTQLAAGDTGNWIVTVANAGFVILCFTGLYLWWPKKWRLSALRAIARPNFRLRGKAFHFNLHNAFGIWALAILTVISVTGLMMSFEWASRLPFTLTRTPAPAENPVVAFNPSAPRFPIDGVVTEAVTRIPDWETLSLSLPTPKNGVYRAQIRALDAPHLSARSILFLNGTTGEVLRWEPFAEFSSARRFRALVLPLHMGTWAGVTGRAINFTACLAALVLVFTGYVLAYKRLAAWRTARRRSPAIIAPAPRSEVPTLVVDIPIS